MTTFNTPALPVTQKPRADRVTALYVGLTYEDWKSGVGWQPELKIDFDLLARQQQKQFLLADDAKKNRLSQDKNLER